MLIFEKKLTDGGKKVSRRWPKKIQTVEFFSKNANPIGKSQSWESVGKRSGRVGTCGACRASVGRSNRGGSKMSKFRQILYRKKVFPKKILYREIFC